MKKTLCLLLVLLLLAGVGSGCGKEPGGALSARQGAVSREALGELRPAQDAEAILAALSDLSQDPVPDWEDAPADGTGLLLETDEGRQGDFIVTDGSFLYMLDSYGLIVASAAGAQSEILSYTRVDRGGSGWLERIYLGEDRAAVVSTVSAPAGEEIWRDSAQLLVILLDTSDKRAPRILSRTALDGSLADAYLCEGVLYLVAQQSLVGLPEQAGALLPRVTENGETASLRPEDVYLCPDPGKTALTVVAALRLSDGRVTDALAFTGGVEAVCGEGDSLCLARSLWTQTVSAPTQEPPYTVVEHSTAARTELKRLQLGESLRLAGGCVLDGALSDPGALRLKDGLLQAATEKDVRSFAAYTDEAHGWTNYELRSRAHSSQLTLLDGELNVTGSLTELGGETGVTACRFTDGLAWMTAPAGELLYTAALSDPAAPAMSGSLPGGGESLLLRPFGEGLVLGFVSPAAGEDWQLVMYDVSDPAAPRLADSMTLKTPAPAAELTDPAAFFSDSANAVIGFPAAGDRGNEYRLVRWTGSAFKEKGVFDLDYVPANARGLLLSGLLYICTPGEIYVTDPETMTAIASVSNAVG